MGPSPARSPRISGTATTTACPRTPIPRCCCGMPTTSPPPASAHRRPPSMSSLRMPAPLRRPPRRPPATIFYTMGGRIVDEGITTATGYVNGPESVAAFSLLKDLYDQGCISPNLLGGGIGTADGHATGKYAMIIDGPWMVDIYKGTYPDFEVNFARIPSGPGGTNSSVVGGEDVVIFGDSQNQEAAMKWAAFLLSPEPAGLLRRLPGSAHDGPGARPPSQVVGHGQRHQQRVPAHAARRSDAPGGARSGGGRDQRPAPVTHPPSSRPPPPMNLH